MKIHRLKGKEEVRLASESEKEPSDADADIARLVERCQEGDFEAFGELYEIYLDRIHRYVFHQVQDKMIAEDLTEEIFLKAWKAIAKYKGRGKGFVTWLYRIAHNHVMDEFRTKRTRRTAELSTSIVRGEAGEQQDNNVTRRELLHLISSLPPQQRQLITLKFIEGLTNPQIQEIIGKSHGAIRVMQMRALATLREKLA